MIDFLKREEVWGDFALGIFNKLEQGRRAVLSDFARCMDPYMNELTGHGYYYTASSYSDGNLCVVLVNGIEGHGTAEDMGIGGRLSMKYSDLLNAAPHGIHGETTEGVLTFMAGTYLQKKASEKMEQKLNSMLEEGKLTLDFELNSDICYKELKDLKFDLLELPRYNLRGRQYTQFPILGSVDDDIKMSDGTFVQIGNTHWFEWQPIIWLVDEEQDRAVTQDILYSGIAFYNHNEKYDGNFNNSLKSHFLRELTKEIRLDKDIIISQARTTREKTGFSLGKLLGFGKKNDDDDVDIE